MVALIPCSTIRRVDTASQEILRLLAVRQDGVIISVHLFFFEGLGSRILACSELPHSLHALPLLVEDHIGVFGHSHRASDELFAAELRADGVMPMDAALAPVTQLAAGIKVKRLQIGSFGGLHRPQGSCTG
uniref:Uncharacterized protein n=1 Tax=Strombidium inclinatum TaxID=197538 RepID=A0A7S3MYJ6_9SPIT